MTHGSWIHPDICLFGLNPFVCLSIICRNEMSLFVPNMVSEILQLWRTWQWKIMRINGGSFESHLVFILLKGTTSIDHHRALSPTTSNHHHQPIIDHHGAQPLAPTTITTRNHYPQPPLSPSAKTTIEHHRKCKKAPDRLSEMWMAQDIFCCLINKKATLDKNCQIHESKFIWSEIFKYSCPRASNLCVWATLPSLT